MALFIEVDDEVKGCPVIINLDAVMEIAPLKSGGCELAFPDAAAVGGKRTMKVNNTYDQFKQFAMQTVSSEDIAKIHGRTTKGAIKEKAPVNDILGNIPKL
jgi:hypothetical protein